MAVTASKRRPGARAARNKAIRHAGACAVLVLTFAPTAHAIDWRFEPYVNASSTYTDNVKQSSSNTQDALILTATPGFTLRSEGSRRVQASLQYGLTGVKRFGGDQSDNFYHNLNAIGKAELVKDFLFIDGSARISQQLISLLGSPADATTNNSNRTTVGTYSISPYIQQRLGTFAFGEVRYTKSGAIFQNNVAANADSNAIAASLKSGTRFTDFSWGLNYSLRKIQNRNAATAANNTDVTFESASATVGYALTRQFRVFGTVGQDWNDYFSTTGTSGSFYSAGFGWSPTRRTSIEASAGERYFGRTFSLAANHRTRLTRWRASYSENVSDISQQFLEQGSRTYWVCNVGGKTLAYDAEIYPQPPAGICLPQPATPFELVGLGVDVTDLVASGDINISVASGIYIIKNFSTGVSWDLGKLGFGFSVQDTRRLYQALSNAEDRVQGITGSVSYRLSSTITANGILSLTRTSLDSAVTNNGVARQDDFVNLSLGLNRRFNDKLYGALTFRHTHRSSNVANAGYDENSLMASVNKRF